MVLLLIIIQLRYRLYGHFMNKMARQYYYIANVADGFGASHFWDYCVKAENVEQAKKIYSEEYYKMFGNRPVAVRVKRTNKATYVDINNREY